MANTFSSHIPSPHDPAANAFAVTPHNTNDLTYATRALFVGGAGTVKVDMLGGDTAVTFTGVLAGSILPIRATRVYATGTSATSIVALY